MNKNFFYLFLGTAAVMAGSAYFFTVRDFNVSEVCFEANCYRVEIARTYEEHKQGLMFREKLDRGAGMLFVYGQDGNYSFWMKNTLVPLDMIWMDKSQKVMFIATNVQPCKQAVCPAIAPEAAARYVLELNAGQAERIGLKNGDYFEFR